MKNRLEYSLDQFMHALDRLNEGATQARDELDRDGVIQRFEFCFELLWKTLKIYLEDRGIEAKSPKDSLRAAFGQGWIIEEDDFLDMLADRNKTSHIYSREESQKIYDRITKQHIPLIKALALRLQSFY
ncbi:MAG: HI0074 family nucleotidyltransferase substrate-binding subunit [Acidobacteriota bacterium]